MANVRKYGCVKPVKNNNPIRWVPRVQPKGNKRKALAADIRKGT